MHSEEIHDAFISPCIVSLMRTMRMKTTGPVVCTGWKRIAYRTLEENPTKRNVGRPRRRWEEINNLDIKELGWGGVAWIRLA
jgi:hypothetical protein